jgi:hypothetical protein
VETTVNERLKILMNALHLSPTAFAKVLGVSGSTVRNYFDSERNTKPGYEVLEKLYHSFGHINLPWLFGAPGSPLVADKLETGTTQTGNSNQAGTGNKQTIKGNNVGIQNGGAVHQYKSKLPVQAEGIDDVEMLKTLVQQLRSQLDDKERTIQILLTQLPK